MDADSITIAEQEKLLKLARTRLQSRSIRLPQVTPVSRDGRLPVSFAQQRLWFLERLGGLGSAYHISKRLRLRGELDAAALERALDTLVARHEPLRTTFAVVDGEPEQRIAPAETSRFSLVEHDLRGRSDRDAELRRIVVAEARAPFDLERGPVIRGRLVRVADEEQVLLLTMHHIVSDAWSMDVLARELTALYAAYRAGEPNPLSPLPVQYADYAAWQRRWVDGEVLQRQAAYWRETLAGAPDVLALPTDRPRPARADYAGDVVPIALDPGLTASLKALSRRHGTTLFHVVLAAWAAVLSRLSGQDDVVIGTPTANRNREEIEGLIGFFVNTLALRVELSGSPTAAELLRRVKARALAAQEHQDIPFEQVVELVQPARSLAHTPLFQVMLAWQTEARERVELPDVALLPVKGATRGGTAKFDLLLSLGERGGRLGGSLEFATALFEKETVERHVGYLRRVLEEMAADEQQTIEQLPLLSAAERRQVVEEWNATDAEYPADAFVHELFEAQAERTPDATAVVFEDRSLTYAELNRRANRLAHHLRERGVGPDVRVGICVERGLEMVVGLLGVLKAGGAYVPLDPGQPAERLAYMLADSAPAVVLTQRELRERVESTDVPVLELAAAAPAWAAHPVTNPGRGALTPAHLAYVIYTSGSTGRPKGVAVPHRGVVNLLRSMREIVGVEPADRVLAVTTYAFDISVLEIFLPLLHGARTVVLPRERSGDPAALADAVRAHAATVMQATPATWRMLVQAGWEGAPEMRALCGGEALPAELASALRSRVGALWNVYGPTETTIWSTAEAVRGDPVGAVGANVPIGRPVANTRVYVLDAGGEPVPVGVAGELYIGGAGVVRGYLGRPELTAERFVADAYGGEPGARLYRTGDLARWRPDGTIEFLGRTDFQVKVRGFRIEPGEVETRLAEHPGVREAVVMARGDVPGDVRLVAYVVGDADAESLRAHLSTALPEYMVPAAYVRLEKLPLTPNGKLDRRALPAPEGDAYASREYEAPAGKIEVALAEIWTELLGVERVGRRDHFFELGGHSLLALQVVSRVWQVMEVDLALGAVFEKPVLAALAERILELRLARFDPETLARLERLALPRLARVTAPAQAAAEYWRTTLSDAPELLELPTDHARPARQDHAGARVGVELDEALSAGLEALSRRHGATLHMTLLAGWAVVLSRLSGQADVVIGTPAAGGGRREIEGRTGFVDALAIRVDLSGAPTAAELLERVKERVLGAQRHQDLPFEQVVELLRPARSLSHHPLFQATLAWRNTPRGDGLPLPAVEAGGDLADGQARFDLALALGEREGRIAGSLTYAAALFERETVERWVGYLRRVLEEMVADERRPVERLALLPESERSRVVEEWNATARPYPDGTCVHELFRAQAARTPEAVALSWHGERLTYAELEARANRLANALRRRGVGPETRVGICLPRTPDLVVAMLGVLGAGGAYVPLDPAYPRERLGFMVEDAAIALVITASAFADRLPESAAARLLLDRERDAIAAESAAAPESGALPGNLSHVIFTSGSTGRPKGVMIRHSSVVVLLHWLRENVTDEERSSVLFSTSINFDVSVAEVFGTLAWGGKLVLVENALELATVGEDVVHASMAPSAAAELLRSGGIPASVKTLNLGGEALPGALAQGLYGLGTVQKVGNLYGPTEDTTYSTYHVVPRGTDQVLIGTPVANTQAYVLDAHLQPVPIGVVGELYLAGDGLSRGYVSRPGMTAERFLPCPFGPPGARMYRVMDHVRRRADGELEYLGRTDFQVKVRSYRIELGEIEARLAEHPGVHAAVALVREDTPGDRRLVAYCVGDGDLEAGTLRSHLADRLPEYMVPAAYVRLERLPLTPNGKVDRRALPAPAEGAYARPGYEAPLGETEQALAEIWAEVLKVERVGRRDDFFALGGHSLFAARVVSQVREVLGVEASSGDLFEQPVLADFARGLETAARAEATAITPVDRTAPIPLSFAQQRLWFLEQMGDLGSTYHIPSGLRLKGALDRDALAGALDRIVARHEVLRTVFAEVGGVPEQRIAPAEASGFHLVEHDLGGRADAEAELGRLIGAEAHAPFDPERGPLVRGRLIRLGADDHVLLLTMHHIVSDGWSMGVLFGELSALYAAFRDGEPDPLPALPVQYADYAAWQRGWVQGELLERQASYWERALTGAPELLELPTDRARPPKQDFAGGSVDVELDEALTAALKALSQRHGATPFMTLLAAWATVLARLSGQDDVVVGTPSANRGRRELEALIGFFVNTLALRVDLSGAPTVAELLRRVRTQALGAQRHQDVPFEQVVERVRPVRSLAHTPLFQVMFAWQNAPDEGLDLPGLHSGAAPGPAHETAKFDLTLTLAESGNRIVGGLSYASALFERATVERYVGYLRRVLEAMVADESQPVERLALVPEDERRRMVEEWNRTDAAAPPSETCVHALFEAQVARAPDAEAVVFGSERLTYAELNAAANRLARRLRAAGVGPEARVGVMLERSAELVVALLAVLKAGGAYLPLDPALPAARRAALAADAGAAVLVTREPALEGFAGTIVSPAEADGEDGGDLGLDVPAAALAYVIYTSGSTGTPKGVGVAHAETAAHCRAAAAAYGLTPADRVLQFAAVGFDVSLEQMLAPLSAGACVVVRGKEVPTPMELARRVAAQGLTVIDPPTAYWHQLAADPDALALLARSVRLVIVGGEAMSPAAAREWASGPAAGVRLLNGYGPTEAVVTCTAYDVPAALPEGAVHVPVGRPLGGRTAYVLDGWGEPVPLGVPGELCIGGVLARGYVGRPAATAAAFVPDPFSATPGARVYRTGDCARWLAAGELEFQGRRDHQVKVRGFRIEPGEIEARLAEHPGVRDPVVLVREDTPGDRRLVAYYLGDEPVAVDALKAHLSDRLPGYMVPAAYVWMETYPLTPNGKVDRRALPAPEGDAYAAREYAAPVGETEEALAAIWAELLGVERVGRRDNFFERGGHSLLAVQVISRMRQVLGVEAPLAHLFSHPTVESLAARLTGADDGHGSDRAIAIRPSGSQLPLFLVHEGAGSIAYAQVLHPHVGGDIPVYALPASPADAPPRTVEGMGTRLVRMIREVQPSGPYRVAGWSFGGVLAYEVAAQLVGRDEVVEFVGMFDSYPPVRAGAVPHDAAQEHALLLHVLRMAEPVESSGRVDPDEAGVATGDVDLENFVTGCREKGLLPGHVTVAQARQMRDRLRNHQRALSEYSPQPLPVLLHQFPAADGDLADPTRGWGAIHPQPRLRVTPVPGTHLSMMRAPNAATLGEALSRALDRAPEEAPPPSDAGSSPIVTLQRGAAGAAPLFCVPGAGSGVTTFVDLMSALGRSVPVHGLQPRGLDGETPPHATVQAAAEHYLRAIREGWPQGPVHLLGHSFGGWVALEMALRLHEAGRPVASLTILDSEVPDDSEAVVRECGGAEAFLRLVEVLELAAERSLGIDPAAVASRNEAGWLQLLHAKMVALGLLSARATPDVLAGPFRTFARCLRTPYRPSGVYPGRLRLVLVDDPGKNEAANRAHFAEVERGWREWAPGLVFSVGAGNHVTALKPPHVAALAWDLGHGQ